MITALPKWGTRRPARAMSIATCLAAVAATCWTAFAWSDQQAQSVARHVREIRLPSARDEIACPSPSAAPLVLLLLGQSNAGNHGSRGSRSRRGALWFAGHCYSIVDPLAGGTGSGGSIWSRLASDLESDIGTRPLLLIVFAVDSARVNDWVGEGPLHERLETLLAELRANRIGVSAILWQQGEADARDNVPRERYAASLTALIDDLRAGGVSAPMLLARSTRCRNTGSPEVREAMALVAARHSNVHLGPDTDTLGSAFRSDGCHFNEEGLERAAQSWREAIRAQHVIAPSTSPGIHGRLGQ
jgi:hypothetical protein